MHVIVQFLNGNDDLTITQGSNNIQGRMGGAGACSIVNVPFTTRTAPAVIIPGLRNLLKAAGGQTRIYLRGHGSWQHGTLGGWTATQVAALLTTNDLHAAHVISVTGCSAGRGAASGAPRNIANMDHADTLAAAQQSIQHSAQSFAGQLHASPIFVLVPSIKQIPLTARTQSVDVDDAGHVLVATGSGHGSQKPGIAGGKYTKVLFYWEGNSQRVRWLFKGDPH